MPNDPLDPLGRVTRHVYEGRVASTVDAPGVMTWTTYDSEGRVIARGSGPPDGNPPAPGMNDTPPDEPHIVE